MAWKRSRVRIPYAPPSQNTTFRIIQNLVDRSRAGNQRFHAEEIQRVMEAGDRFINMTPAEFPEEDRRLLEES
jgi:hypothetical protein